MRKVVLDLIDATRALRLMIVDKGDAGRGVKIGVPLPEFQSRLLGLADALEAVDADGALSIEGASDPEKLRAALDATFKWIQLQGLDITQPLELVAQAVGHVDTKTKAKSGFSFLPAFVHGRKKKKKGWKPTLTLQAERLSAMTTLDDHMRAAREMEETFLKMGGVAPNEVSSDNPMATPGF